MILKVPRFHQPLKSHPSCSTKSYRCTCTPRWSFRGGTGAGRSSQRPSNPVMVRGDSASATWWYTTTAPYGTIAAVHGMHQNVSTGCFFLPKKWLGPPCWSWKTSKSWRCRSIFLLVFRLISLPSGKQTWQWKVAPVSSKGGKYIFKWSIFDIFWDFG